MVKVLNRDRNRAGRHDHVTAFGSGAEGGVYGTGAGRRPRERGEPGPKSTLIPYVEAEPQVKDGYFIKEVIVGPTPNPDLSIESIKGLFRSLNHPEVTVRASNVPYRHW